MILHPTSMDILDDLNDIFEEVIIPLYKQRPNIAYLLKHDWRHRLFQRVGGDVTSTVHSGLRDSGIVIDDDALLSNSPDDDNEHASPQSEFAYGDRTLTLPPALAPCWRPSDHPLRDIPNQSSHQPLPAALPEVQPDSLPSKNNGSDGVTYSTPQSHYSGTILTPAHTAPFASSYDSSPLPAAARPFLSPVEEGEPQLDPNEPLPSSTSQYSDGTTHAASSDDQRAARPSPTLSSTERATPIPLPNHPFHGSSLSSISQDQSSELQRPSIQEDPHEPSPNSPSATGPPRKSSLPMVDQSSSDSNLSDPPSSPDTNPSSPSPKLLAQIEAPTFPGLDLSSGVNSKRAALRSKADRNKKRTRDDFQSNGSTNAHGRKPKMSRRPTTKLLLRDDEGLTTLVRKLGQDDVATDFPRTMQEQEMWAGQASLSRGVPQDASPKHIAQRLPRLTQELGNSEDLKRFAQIKNRTCLIDFYRCHEAAKKKPQEFFRECDRLLPRQSRKPSGRTMENTINLYFVELGFSQSSLQHHQKELNSVKNWLKEAKPWFRLVENFGYGMLLCVPDDMTNSL